MRFVASLLAALAVIALTAEPSAAEGKRKKDSATGVYCQSGKHVTDASKCKENGGNK